MPRRALAVALTLLAGGCTAANARMSYRTVDSAAMGHPMEYGVYTPPEFRPGESLPVFLFLHGGGDDAHCLDAAGISAYLDEGIRAGQIPRVVVVVPQGDKGFWANWADGSHRYQDWVFDEALPSAADEFHTQRCPEGCHVMGISMGGNGAVRLALAKPGAFSSLGVLSGPILDVKGMESVMGNWLFRTFARLGRVFDVADKEGMRRNDPFQRWRSPEDLQGLELYFAHGDHDTRGIAETNAAFAEHLTAHGISHRYVVFHGGHRWHDWEPLFGDYLRFALAANRTPPHHESSVLDPR